MLHRILCDVYLEDEFSERAKKCVSLRSLLASKVEGGQFSQRIRGYEVCQIDEVISSSCGGDGELAIRVTEGVLVS